MLEVGGSWLSVRDWTTNKDQLVTTQGAENGVEGAAIKMHRMESARR